jgi:DNA-binding PadR family transcriptional regulator
MNHPRYVNDLTALEEDVLTLLHSHAYSGMQILPALSECNERRYTPSSVYRLLKRLVRKNLLATHQRLGRRRDYYTITSLGTERLTACRQRRLDLAVWVPPTPGAGASGCINCDEGRAMQRWTVLPDKVFHMGLI